MLEKTLESPLGCKETQPVHPKGNQSWIFIGRTDVKLKLQYLGTWCEELTRLKRHWCRKRLKVGDRDDRGWDGWMASPTQWTPIWVNSGSWWWTGRPGVLQFMGSQRVRHDWETKLNWTEYSPLMWFQGERLLTECEILIFKNELSSECTQYIYLCFMEWCSFNNL